MPPPVVSRHRPNATERKPSDGERISHELVAVGRMLLVIAACDFCKDRLRRRGHSTQGRTVSSHPAALQFAEKVCFWVAKRFQRCV